MEWLGLDFHFDIRLMYGSEGIGMLASVGYLLGSKRLEGRGCRVRIS